MATVTITGQVKLRNDTAANWTSENPVLSQGEMGIETDTLKAKIGDGITAWNSLGYAWGGIAPDKSRMIEFIKTTNTAAGAALTGVSQDSSLYDGKTIFLYLSYAAGSNATLNLTLADGTKTGAKPLYYTGTTRMTTHYGAGSVVSLTYVASVDGWRRADYNTDANYYDRILMDEVRFTAGTNGIKQWSLIMQKPDGTWESLTTTDGQSTNKTKNTNGFLLGKVYRYNYSTNIASGSLTAKDYIYDVTSFDVQYSTNCGTTLTANKSLYIVGTIGSDGLFYLADTWWTQTLPTTEDGKVYIYIGEVYSTYQCILSAYNPVFWYKDGAFRRYSHTPSEYVKSSSLAAVATSGSYNDLSNKPTIPSLTNTTRTIEYIIGTQTAATGAWTGVTVDDTLYDGKIISYFLPYAGSGDATLELTLSDGQTTTGAIPVYMSNGTTRFGTQVGAGNSFLLIYNATANKWSAMQYWTSDTNTYDRTLLNDVRVYAGTNGIKQYSLVMQKADGTWESCTTTSGTGTSKTKNTSGFLIGKLWRYAHSSNVASGSLTTNDYLYECQPIDLRYSLNCGKTLVARKPIYLVGTIGADGLFYLDTPWYTQTEPSTDDGKVYMYVGEVYSTYEGFLCTYNPLYWYKDGAFRLYSNSKRITTTDIDEIIAGQ